jgi:polyisoprenoid-binding protein YceI
MAAIRSVGVAVTLVASLGAGRALPAEATQWSADRAGSQIVVNVYKKGLLSGMAHDHRFSAGEFRVTATTGGASPAPTRFEVVVMSGSLRDGAPDLSPSDRTKVDAQAAGEDVLYAAHFPEIRFASREPPTNWAPPGPDGSAGGDLVGELTLRGRERPVTVVARTMAEGKRLRVRGSVRFRQSDFGIDPYSGFLGMVAVEDEIQVDFNLLLEPAREG